MSGGSEDKPWYTGLEDAKNVQDAIQKARERENNERKKAQQLEERLNELEAAEKKRKMESMSETERYQSENQNLKLENARLKLGSFVESELAKYPNLPERIKADVRKQPFAISEVQDALSDDPNPEYDKVVELVRQHLPTYLSELSSSIGSKPESDPKDSGEDLPVEPDNNPVDAERPVNPVTKTRQWTRSMVGALSVEDYKKYEPEILAFMKANNGRLPE